jgi:prenyltransferase beta subunit
MDKMGFSESAYLQDIFKGLLRATCWVIDNQDENGSWGRTKEESNDIFSTYLCIWALSELGLSDSEIVTKAVNWFKRIRNRDGGWGYQLSKQSSLDQTVRGLITFIRMGLVDETFHGVLKETILKAQNEDGSWPREITGEYEPEVLVPVGIGDIGATLPVITFFTMLKPYSIFSQDIPLSYEKAIKWVIESFNEDGGCGFKSKGSSDPLATAWALRALAEADVCTPAISNGVKYLKEKILSDGIWGMQEKASIIYTYNCVHSLILCGFNLFSSEIKEGLFWLLRNQYKDGSWGEGGLGTTRYTASLVLVLARALKSTKETFPYCTLISSSFERRKVQFPLNVLSQKQRVTKGTALLLAGLMALIYVFGLFTPQLLSLCKGLSRDIGNLWANLSLKLKAAIGLGIAGLLLIILINIFSTFLYNVLQNLFGLIKKAIRKNTSSKLGGDKDV